MRMFCCGVLLSVCCCVAAAPGQADSLGITTTAADLGQQVQLDGANNRYSTAKLKEALRPIVFEDNRGQAPSDTRFLARSRNYTVHLASNGLAVEGPSARHGKRRPGADVARLRFVGAQAHAEASGEQKVPGVSNYFLGSGYGDFTNIANYSRVRFSSIYPGIDIVYYGTNGELEYDLVLSPGAEAKRIHMATAPHSKISSDKHGGLDIVSGGAVLHLKPPVAYQETNGQRQPVEARFHVTHRGDINLALGPYNHGQSLVIDPVLSYSTYLGGSNDDFFEGIAVDSSGNAYVIGYTSSMDFPILSAYQSSFGHNAAGPLAFITKFNATGTAIIYSTFLGDPKATNWGLGIAVDGSENAFVTGKTTSTAFPTTASAYQTTSPGGANNSFITKLGPAGNTLVYSTYVRGAATAGIAIDASGSAYVTGTATTSFTTTSGVLQASSPNPSGNSAFVLKLNSSGSAATYATFLGGSSGDAGYSVAVDGSGNAHVGGLAQSSDFPVYNAVQSAPQGGNDGFVAKLNQSGSALLYSTRLGGSDYDIVYSVTVDSQGSAYATGQTRSFNFPVTPNAFQKTKGGVSYNGLPNGFVVKLPPGGKTLVYSSFLGGNGGNGSSYGDWGYSIAIDSGGHAFIAGEIGSTLGFPLVGDLNPGQPESTEGLFVAKISALGDAVLYATHIGWRVEGVYMGVAVDSNGDAYAESISSSGDIVITDNFLISSGSYRTTPYQSRDGVVLKLTTGASINATLSTSATTVDNGAAVSLTATAAYTSGSGIPAGSIIVYDGTSQLMSLPLSAGAASATLTLPVGIHALAAVYRSSGSEGVSPTVYVAVNPSSSCN